jgi:membrane fusion protein (multidrug efflux system)
LRKLVFPLILGALVVAGAIWGWRWWSESRFFAETDNAYVKADSAVIAPRVAGYVAEVAVADNQAVVAGDLLFRLDDRDWRVAVERARADVARARAGMSAQSAATASEGSGIGEAAAALAAARAQAAQARADLARIEPVWRAGFTTKAVHDAAVAAAASREAAVAQAEAALAAQQARRTAAASRGGGAGAEAQAARAALEAAELTLSYAQVRAPIAGVVGARSVRVGEYLRAGQQAMVIVPVGQAYVVANFKETQVARMRPGQRVALRLDAFPDAPLRGRVESLSPASGSEFSVLPPENATGNFTKVVQRLPVRIVIDRPLPEGVRLAPGLSVTARVDLRSGG